MLKILIVDDEPDICELIHKLIDWEELELTSLGSSQNGIDAMEIIPVSYTHLRAAPDRRSGQGHGGPHMSTRAGTVPLSDLQFIKIYFNRKRLRSTPANLRKMLVETGGDAICNGSIFLRNQTPACHLKADGTVCKSPDYRTWAVSWNTPADFGVKAVPNGDANYMECVHLIIGGKKISLVTLSLIHI